MRFVCVVFSFWVVVWVSCLWCAFGLFLVCVGAGVGGFLFEVLCGGGCVMLQ